MLCLGNATISTGSGKCSPNTIVVNTKIKFEQKSILVSFLLSLIPFTAFTQIRR